MIRGALSLQDDRAPLLRAAHKGSPAVVRMLLDAGANVEAKQGANREGTYQVKKVEEVEGVGEVEEI